MGVARYIWRSRGFKLREVSSTGIGNSNSLDANWHRSQPTVDGLQNKSKSRSKLIGCIKVREVRVAYEENSELDVAILRKIAAQTQ